MELIYKSISIFNLDNDKEFYYTSFQKTFNLINGTNRVGKSTIAKAIFFSMGADIVLDELQDNIEDIATILEVEINKNIYFFVNRTVWKKNQPKQTQLMFLNKDQEVLFLCNKYKGRNNYEDFTNNFLKYFNLWDWIKLRIKYDSEIWKTPYLSTLLDFFYIDQEGWINDFNNFKSETSIFKSQDLELLIGVFLNRIEKEDFDLIDKQQRLKNEILELKYSKNAYSKLLSDVNDKNGISGLLDEKYIKKYINIKSLIENQKLHFESLKEFKSLMLTKITLNQILKENENQIDNIKTLSTFFPKELAFINKHGECETLSFNEIITFKSKEQDSQNDIKEIKQKLKIITNKLNLLEKEIKQNQTIYFESLKEKSNGKFDLSKLKVQELEHILKLNHNINFEIKNIDIKVQELKNKQIDINEQWLFLLTKNKVFLDELTNELNEEIHKLHQTVHFNYYLNQLNSENSKKTNISGTDKTFFKLVQKGLFYNLSLKNPCKIKFPLVIDTPNKDDFHEENWEIICKYISDDFYSKTQIILMSTRMPNWNIDFNLIKLEKNQRSLLRNNNYDLIPNIIKEIKEQIFNLLKKTD